VANKGDDLLRATGTQQVADHRVGGRGEGADGDEEGDIEAAGNVGHGQIALPEALDGQEEDEGIHKALEYILEYSENASVREFIKPMLDKRPTVKYANRLISVGLEDLDVGVKISATTLKKLDYYRARTVVYYIDGLMRDSLEITIDEDNIITHIERRVRG